ncbi:MAG: hypothetical protein ABSC20_10660 [Candidatus Bathyarchaeia archaeon]
MKTLFKEILIGALVAVFAHAFKKGYITDEVVDEERLKKPQMTTQYKFSLRASPDRSKIYFYRKNQQESPQL